MWNYFVIFLLCLVANPLSGQKSLFESEIGGDENRRLNIGVNLPPKFLPGGDMEGFSLPEDTAVGTIVYRLRGEDPEGSRVAYSISGDHLSVVRNTGAVTLVKPLDHEAAAMIEVIITLTDEKGPTAEPNIVSIRREIIIEDRNDNPPKFSEPSYTFSVNETIGVNTQVFNKILISDADSGSNGEIKLTCLKQKSPEGCEKFAVRSQRIAPGKFAGIVSARSGLNYEESSRFTLVLQAEDLAKEPGSALTSTATITVEVLDVQDQPPVFLNAPYRPVIQENSPVGHPLMKVLVRDGDTGQPRDLQLDIIDDPLGYFRVSSFKMNDNIGSATIVASDNPVDREDQVILRNGGTYSFGLKATELVGNKPVNDFTVENVTVMIIDVNDQPPVFNQAQYSIGIPENLDIGEALPGLDMTVSDSDTGVHSQFGLELIPLRNADNIFEVHPMSATGRTPVLIKVTGADKLDYENPDRREMVVQVIARGGGRRLSSTATLTILLVDVNDNNPIFEEPSYSFNVVENSAPGLLIARLSATDADSGVYGQLRYELRGFGSEHFSVNASTGDLSVGVCGLSTCLDYEDQDIFTLTFTAIDGGGKSTSVPLTIKIDDVNDNPPVFEQNQYRRLIQNRAIDFDPQLVLKATDKDGMRKGHSPPTQDGRISYSIIAGNTADNLFSIGRDSGILDVTRPINATELGEVRFVLTVRATDSGTPPQHADTVVTITVGAVDGNDPPIFQQSHYHINVVERATPDSFVIQLNATDPDGPTENLRYRVVGGSAVDWFTVDEVSGIVRVARGGALQWDQESPLLTLAVAAVDQGQPIAQTATATLTIQVEDINDKPPSFDKQLFIHHVAEVTAVGTRVLALGASDPDTSSQLRFRLTEPFQIRNKGGYLRNEIGSEYFSISETTGILTLTKPLDHENAAVVMFRAEVEDMNASQEFPNQTDVAEVAIYVQAHTDNGPIFSPPWSPAHPIIRAEVVEEQDPGIIFLTLQAHDPVTGLLISHFELVDEQKPISEALTSKQPDSGTSLESLFDQIRFTNDTESVNDTAKSILDPDISSLIELNKLTGELTFKRRIDYEELVNKSLQFQVQAIAGEAENRRMSLATVKLDILDANDNSPQFAEEEYKVKIPESIHHPDVLVTVSATDKDSGKFGQILYFVSGDGADLFVIDDPTTGIVRVAPNVSLDREKQPSYTFTIIAADQPQGSEEQQRSSVLVMVELIDVNDNAPAFTQSSYTAVVPENAPLDWSVSQVEAVDPDEQEGGIVEYSLVNGGRLEGLLTVMPNTGSIIVKGPLTGKGRSEPYVLTLRAQDKGESPLFSDIDINVYVGDITPNDGVPSFVKPSFDEKAYIVEEAPIGSIVFQALAIDPDDPATPNGRLTYKFLDDGTLGSDHAFFEIHPATGVVTTKARLDRESKASYTLILVARDQGTPSQQATRRLNIIVRDIDDHPPQFIRTPYDGPLQFSVLEQVEPGWCVDQLRASDPDQGENAAIEYLIIFGDDAGVFTLERNPDNLVRLLVKGTIDREVVDSYLLTIKCFKPAEKPSELRKMYNPQDTSEIQVKITVKDIDDNDPVFVQTNITTGVRLNAPLHTEVVRLEAIDPDAESGPVFYKLLNVSFIRAHHYASSGGDTQIDSSPAVAKTFDLDTSSGLLTTSQTYGLFVDGYFLLHVCAWTGEESRSRKAFNTLKIYILRDSELMKFVFTKPPPDVKPILADFRQSVEQSLELPLTLNLYESQFYSRDGALDFSSTSSCFQLVGKDHVFDLKDTELLLNAERNQRLRSVYDKFSVANLERCVPRGTLYEINNLEIWLLVIGCLIGAMALIAALTTCCLFTRYESRMKKLNPGIQVAERSGTGTRRSSSIVQPHASLLNLSPDSQIYYDGHSSLARSVL
ncbi:hypothetical protein GHT06_015672 [Daphnia sinensis]|uniref:Cadherin domain-containing protein n=1 Tax=Daphnia sinensis TaxID=1820382 RepID=A0AAD5PUU6_9CRUS|nr:hypothetical protein GHT06_015672 [Daphnia sinensis]